MKPGDKLGPYEIVALIGKGGMGEVYLAHDSRLKRDVAIKVSAAQFSERFEREAQAIAALNHSNICQLYDVGPNYLVMEYIEGTPLKGPLPLDQALKYAAQICDALDAAHKKGITHRDLKLANILVTKAGIKLLDFGLAKLSSSGIAQAPKPDEATLTMALTGKNEIVGTLYYMSPEQLQAQASGQEIDSRSDIFSFGLVLYEMLTGKRAFEGTSPASVIAAIMERAAPSISDIAPPALDRVLKVCLAKDPDERWQTARDLKRELEWIASASGEAAVDAAPSRLRLAHAGWVVAGVLAITAATISIGYFRATRRFAVEPSQTIKLSMLLPEAASVSSGSLLALSPDGRHLAFVVTTDRISRLWVHDLGMMEARAIPGTEGAYDPFWSPDSAWLGFNADNKLKKISLAGGPAITLCESPGGRFRGATWGKNGDIVFAPGNGIDGLFRVDASGGAANRVTKLDSEAGDINHRFPWFLPDGQHFIYTAPILKNDQGVVWVGDIASSRKKRLLEARSLVMYVDPGYLLFVREQTLMAMPFDAGRLEITGEAVPIAEKIGLGGVNIAQYQFTTSQNGTLAFEASQEAVGDTLTWFDRRGKELERIGGPEGHGTLAISPDGSKLVVLKTRDQRDLWLMDLPRGAPTRFTFDANIDQEPVWSPDGRYIIWTSNRFGNLDLFRKPSSGTGPDQTLLLSKEQKHSEDWSRDGRFLLYSQISANGSRDLMILPLNPDGSVAGKPSPFWATPFNEGQARFSPDGHWIVYRSDESGKQEIYVQPFPASAAGGKWQISAGEGYQPRWRSDGKEIFYYSEDRKMMAVKVSTSPTFRAEASTALFQVEMNNGLAANAGHHWDVSPDGQRFLINVAPVTSRSAPLTVVLNWQAALKK